MLTQAAVADSCLPGFTSAHSSEMDLFAVLIVLVQEGLTSVLVSKIWGFY